jgi:hypothetical protein
MASNSSLQGRNRTSLPGNTDLSGKLYDNDPITGTGVTPEQAAEIAMPLDVFLRSIPYEVDARGNLAYKTSVPALTHAPELTYADNHPDPSLAGQPAEAMYQARQSYMVRHGGAPMPFIDMDGIQPEMLAKLLTILTNIRDQQMNAT